MQELYSERRGGNFVEGTWIAGNTAHNLVVVAGSCGSQSSGHGCRCRRAEVPSAEGHISVFGVGNKSLYPDLVQRDGVLDGAQL